MGSSDVAGAVGFWVITAIFLVIGYYVFVAIALGKIFVKLGEQGWKAWIPFINTITMYELGGYTALWVIALFFPVVDFVALVILILAINNMNKRLGYGGGFTFLALFFYPIWAGVVGFGRHGDGGVILAKAKVKSDSISTGSYPILASQETRSPETMAPVPAVPAKESRVEVMDAGHSQTGEWEPLASPTSVETQPAPGNEGRRMVPPPPNVTGPVSPVPPPPPVASQAIVEESNPWAPTGEVRGVPPVPPPPAPATQPVVDIESPSVEPSEPSPVVSDNPAEGAPNEWVPNLPDDSSVGDVAPAEDESSVAEEIAPTVIAVPVTMAAAEDDDEEIDATVLSSRRKPKWKISIDGSDPIILEKTTIVIGRNPTSTVENVQLVSLKDSTKTVSKTHARLVLEKETWTIWDLKSTNGVFLLTESGQEQELPAGGSAPLTEKFILGELPVRLFRDK